MMNSDFWVSSNLVDEVLLACGNNSPTPMQCKFVDELLSFVIVNPAAEGVKSLSERERTCLFWVAHGKTIEEMAALMHIKTTTVQTYHQRIRSKLRCATLAQAVFWVMCYQPVERPHLSNVFELAHA